MEAAMVAAMVCLSMILAQVVVCLELKHFLRTGG